VNARPYGIVAHEAAHVVVGVALGLRLHSAVVKRWYAGARLAGGWTWFPRARRVQDALIVAAGVAWSQATRDGLGALDVGALWRVTRKTTANFDAYVLAAGAILESRALAHARVIRALLEHDLTHADVERLARGVSPTRLREDEP
jgi:hypothetical protein